MMFRENQNVEIDSGHNASFKIDIIKNNDTFNSIQIKFTNYLLYIAMLILVTKTLI